MRMSRILIVDDEENIRSLLSTYLNSLGYQTMVAEDGTYALELMKSDKPDIVLLDIKLPGMDGIEILKKIKEHDPGISVIMISGYATEKLAKKSLEIGAFDYINKPVDLEKVSEVICCVDLLK